MIVYHGSNSKFNQLRISKSLLRSESSLLNEGLGIYFSTDKEVAKSYGKYLYTLEVNDRYIKNLRTKTAVKNLLNSINNKVYKHTNVDISKYYNFDNLVFRIVDGGISLNNLDKEIELHLDSNYNFYNEVKQYKVNLIGRLIRKYIKENLKAYLFNFNIKGIGIIKDVSEDVVRIVSIDLVK